MSKNLEILLPRIFPMFQLNSGGGVFRSLFFKRYKRLLNYCPSIHHPCWMGFPMYHVCSTNFFRKMQVKTRLVCVVFSTAVCHIHCFQCVLFLGLPPNSLWSRGHCVILSRALPLRCDSNRNFQACQGNRKEPK